tara:strand:- start:220 stop:423 length:204 start_codon:yes stop_codon:yes gene_type:complete
MKRAFLITSLFITFSGCEQVALTAFGTAFLKEATKAYSDEPTEAESAEYDTQLDALEVENIDVIELE